MAGPAFPTMTGVSTAPPLGNAGTPSASVGWNPPRWMSPWRAAAFAISSKLGTKRALSVDRTQLAEPVFDGGAARRDAGIAVHRSGSAAFPRLARCEAEMLAEGPAEMRGAGEAVIVGERRDMPAVGGIEQRRADRKSTRLNSSH